MAHRGAFPRSSNSPIALVTSPFSYSFFQLVRALEQKMVRYKFRLVLNLWCRPYDAGKRARGHEKV
jgi:hypothetical protein